MAKINLPAVTGNRTTNAALNSRLATIEQEFMNKVLYRDNPLGEPNEMNNDIDMNSTYKLVNVADGEELTDSVNLKQLKEYSAGTNPVYTPVQVTDGVSDTYTTPLVGSTVPEHYFVFIGGTYQDPGEYTLGVNGDSIIFNSVPPAGQDLVVIGYKPTLNIVDGSFLQPAIKEKQVLAAPVAGVQEATFTTSPENAAIYVLGQYIDNSLLQQTKDYTILPGNKIRLVARTFPAGTEIVLAAPEAIDPVSSEFITRITEEIISQGNSNVNIKNIAYGASIYDTVAAGLAATVDGEYFFVVSSDPSIGTVLYQNDNGASLLEKTFPSSQALADATFFTRDTDALMLVESPNAGEYYCIGGQTVIGDGKGDLYVVSDTDDSGENLLFANGKFAVRVTQSPAVTSAAAISDPFPASPREGDLHIILEEDQTPVGSVVGVLTTTTGGVFGSGLPSEGSAIASAAGSVEVEEGSYLLEITLGMNPDEPPTGGVQAFSVEVNVTGDIAQNVATFQFWRDGAIYKGSGSTAHHESQQMSGAVVLPVAAAGVVGFEASRVTSNVNITDLTVKVTRL